ncbi:hypothetical protein [Maribacter sp. 4G9]|uniref:hypothetical protein n=1 Tax=Maribacter sp. 4G9 TaxID=1889777 RepID=UPI000C15817C|nr:hypothetical protein [Maribacter sp. 4G9]PIB38627.1 hypothetical protein BFP75_15220 [Maribacter sp. 4G9]
MKEKDKILVIGGYGTVGAIVSRQLALRYPSKIIVAGRNKLKAENFIQKKGLIAKAIFMDIEKERFENVNFSEVHTVVNCIETMNISFILECIQLNINYTEVGASFRTHKRFYEIWDYIDNSDCLVIPSVGLVPGLSNIFAFNGAKQFSEIDEIHTYMMLGLGEAHGVDSIRWMLEKANSSFKIKTKEGSVAVKGFTHPKSSRLLNEQKERTFYLFDFSDHHTIPLLVDTNAIDTRIGFDSRTITYLFYLLRKTGVLKWFKNIGPKRFKKVLDFIRMGSERFGLQIEINGRDSLGMQYSIKYLATGENEALATATVTSYAAELMYLNKTQKGLKHIEEVCDLDELKGYLEKHNIRILNNIDNENDTVQPSGKPGTYGTTS